MGPPLPAPRQGPSVRSCAYCLCVDRACWGRFVFLKNKRTHTHTYLLNPRTPKPDLAPLRQGPHPPPRRRHAPPARARRGGRPRPRPRLQVGTHSIPILCCLRYTQPLHPSPIHLPTTPPNPLTCHPPHDQPKQNSPATPNPLTYHPPHNNQPQQPTSAAPGSSSGSGGRPLLFIAAGGEQNEVGVWDLSSASGRCKQCFRAVLPRPSSSSSSVSVCVLSCCCFGGSCMYICIIYLIPPNRPIYPPQKNPKKATTSSSSAAALSYTAPLPSLEEVPLPSRLGDPVLQAPDACVASLCRVYLSVHTNNSNPTKPNTS